MSPHLTCPGCGTSRDPKTHPDGYTYCSVCGTVHDTTEDA